MMYSRNQLNGMSFEDISVPMQRYLHKFVYDKNNFKRLKWHEKDFFFHNLQLLKNDKDFKAFDLLEIPEAADYLFEKIILIYANDGVFDFTKKTRDYDGLIKNARQEKYKSIFWQKLSLWRQSLKSRKGIYESIISPMWEVKLKELDSKLSNKSINRQTFIKKRNYIDAVFYHIYYKVRCYFDELKNKREHQIISGFVFYADIYTYSHVLSRHYFPYMNDGIGGTINDDIPYVDVFELPSSLFKLISDYASVVNITEKTEYLLFEMNGSKYILWIRIEKNLSMENRKQFQIRSFYRCTQQFDLEKFKGLTKKHIRNYLYAFV